MSEIFKAYDIRGVYPSEINEDIAYRIGRAFVKFLKCKNVVVGKDMRESCDKLFDALAKGINDEGADVIFIGKCTTPMFYFCVAKYGYDSGVMITASHNPAEYNGFKLVREKAIPVGEGSGMEEIKKLASGDLGEVTGGGKITEKEFMRDYIESALRYNNVTKKLKVVIDYGNGMGSLEADNVIKDIDLDLVEMYKEPDGNFPNHEANPLKEENTADLRKRVVSEKADLGIAFDGDCDRVGFIDEKGGFIPGDFILALIGKVMLEKNPGATILYDLRASKIVKEFLEENGAKTLKSRVGHAFIKKQMRDNNAVFAGELSMHFYFKDEDFYAESSIGAILMILSLLSASDKRIGELVEPLKKYYQSGEINSEVEDKEGKMKEIEERYKDGKIEHLDGVSIEYDDFWFNVRPSNTEPLLRLNLEAKTRELMEEKRDEVLRIIRG
ncbi:phosphomannomutase/phosphoglucomutase [Candidatus Woesearchaeota archaeon]|nr:phosphomannomutase/phosphoglucomutase [Candidatus Woesearchaeota archaeon]